MITDYLVRLLQDYAEQDNTYQGHGYPADFCPQHNCCACPHCGNFIDPVNWQKEGF